MDRLAGPRADGLRAALRVLLTGRRGLDTRRTALNALVRTTDLGVDARKALTAARVTMISGWAEDASATVDRQIARQEAPRLAAAVKDADRHLRRMKAPLKELVEQLAPGFLTRPGMPGHSNDAHRHPNCEEVIYVMSGQCDQRVGDSIRPLTAGEGVVIPRGVPHSSINTGDEVLNVLVSYSTPNRVVEPVGVPADVHT